MGDLSEIEQLAVAMSESLEGCVVSAGDGYELDAERAYEMILKELKQFRQDDPYRLPMELLPDGWELAAIGRDYCAGVERWEAFLKRTSPQAPGAVGYGPTPRAAMLAAIERIPPQHN